MTQEAVVIAPTVAQPVEVPIISHKRNQDKVIFLQSQGFRGKAFCRCDDGFGNSPSVPVKDHTWAKPDVAQLQFPGGYEGDSNALASFEQLPA